MSKVNAGKENIVTMEVFNHTNTQRGKIMEKEYQKQFSCFY